MQRFCDFSQLAILVKRQKNGQSMRNLQEDAVLWPQAPIAVRLEVTRQKRHESIHFCVDLRVAIALKHHRAN